MRNNFVFGIIGGAIAAVIGAGIWAAVTVATGYQIGWMAVAVGILVGFAVRFTGQGTIAFFSIVGAFFALLGCILGNVFSGIGFLAQEWEVGYFEAMLQFNYGATFELLKATFAPMDLLFYAIAVWEGFKFAVLPDA